MRRGMVDIALRADSQKEELSNFVALAHWLTTSIVRLNPGGFQLGGAWIAGRPGGRGLPRGLELVRQLEALKMEQFRRGQEAGHSWRHVSSAVALEAYRRADLAVIAAAGLEDELVITAGH